MKSRLPSAVGILLALTQSGVAGERSVNPPYSIFNSGPWELRIFCEDIGSQKESRRGVLLKDGKEIAGNQVGEVIQTDFADRTSRLKYFGPTGKTSGWYFADTTLMCSDLPTDDEK